MKKLCAILCLLLFTACSPGNEQLYPDNPSKRTVPVFIISHGWHTGIVVESGYVSDRFMLNDQFPRAHYLMFEWGDAGYFPNDDPGISTLLKAALLPTDSVIQVTGMNVQPHRYFRSSTTIQIDITPAGMQSLQTFLYEQFYKDDEERFVFVQQGLYPNSVFFKSKQVYMLPRTSNSWTAKALQQTGYPVTPLFTVTSGRLISQAKKDGVVLQEE